MNIEIRSERISDYANIANANYEAFLGWHPDNQYVSEPLIVDLLRHNSLFNPDLSLVAVLDGKVIGHALFSPFKFVVMGQEQSGVVLAPIAVEPEHQKKGVGKMLIEEGHQRAANLGYSFSLLCGHDTYYPKFGYITGMFAVEGAKINIMNNSFNIAGYNDRPVRSEDLPWIMEKWHKLHGRDQLALFPGENISQWHSQSLESRCSVITRNDAIIGLLRYERRRLWVKELLAENKNVAEILSYVFKKYGKAEGELHSALPYECLMQTCQQTGQFNISDSLAAYSAFMIKVLHKDSLIESYCKEVQTGCIKPGIIVFPSMFDIDDGRVE